MQQPFPFWKKPQTAKLLLALSGAVLLFYLLTLYIIADVYRYPAVGAISELLALPMLILLVAIPVVLLLMIFKGARAFRYYYIGALLLWIATLVTLVFY